MKKSRQQLELLADIVSRAYSRQGKLLEIRDDKEISLSHHSLGYSYKTEGHNVTRYVVGVSKLPAAYEYTEFRAKIHEIGHIYLGHFEGIHEELDRAICNVFRDYKDHIVGLVNQNCGIDYAEALISKVIDDPVLNHFIHGLAMDMEVNSKLLSAEDIEEMNSDLADILKEKIAERMDELKEMIKDGEKQIKVEQELEKIIKRNQIKYVLPGYFTDSTGTPFPDGSTYPEYLIMIIQNLDKFLKFLSSIDQGKGGNTSDITDEQLSDILNGLKKGDGSGAEAIDELLKKVGIKTGNETDEEKEIANLATGEGDKPYDEDPEELGPHDTSNSGGKKGNGALSENQRDGLRDDWDHYTPKRQEADELRQYGKIKAGGGVGLGDGGAPLGIRESSTKNLVDTAIDEAILDQKSRVVQISTHRDLMKNWNLGRNRTVIAPSISQKIKIDTNPRIVYLIDISGSMDTVLIDRIMASIAKKMKSINKGLRYDVITWSTEMGEHLKDIDPKKGVPRLRTGGGTRLGAGIEYFRKNYKEDCILIVASDFEDYLHEWVEVMKKMKGYSVWGFNYGATVKDVKWPKNFKLRNFNQRYVD